MLQARQREPLLVGDGVAGVGRWSTRHPWRAIGAWLAFVAEFLNATLHKETVQSRQIGPVAIPSIGLEGGF